MKLPYGYVLIGGEIVVHEEKADVIRSIFDDYLAGASLGKIVDLLFKKRSNFSNWESKMDEGGRGQTSVEQEVYTHC